MDLVENVPHEPAVKRIGLLGSGIMGKQIALLCASHGLSVTVWNHVTRDSFPDEILKMSLLQAKQGFVRKESVPEIASSIRYTSRLDELRECDFVIETVKENKGIKTSLLQHLDHVAAPGAIISTNSSTFSTTELASLLKKPNRFIGIHFFNPPVSMKLVEVIRGELTDDDTVTTSLGLLSTLGKHPVVLPETPGFVVNRLLFPMINEAIFLLSEGIADEKTIDGCMKMGANHPMGPLELADFIGLDVCLSILETLVHETGDAKYRPAHLLKKYVRAGKLGRKSGVGFYSYRKRG